MEATIAGPVTAPERKPVEITPATTAKQLAEAVEPAGGDFERVQRTQWLRKGPFGARIVQARFHVPFKEEDCSSDPVGTLAEVYVRLRRHWPVWVDDNAWWLVNIMRKWWGGLRTAGSAEIPGDKPPPPPGEADDGEDDEDDEEDEDPMPGSVTVDMSTSGAYSNVPIWRDFRAEIEFDDDDVATLRTIRGRFRSGEISRDHARRMVQDLLSELARAQYENGEAEETDVRYGDSSDGSDCWDDETIDDEDIESFRPACDIVRTW